MTTQEFLKGALSKAASTASRLVPQIKPAVAVAKGVMNEVSKAPSVQPGQVLKTAANMAMNTNPVVATAKSIASPVVAGVKSMMPTPKPAQTAPVAGPTYSGPVQNARPPVATPNPSPAIRPPAPANPMGPVAPVNNGFTSNDPAIRAQVAAMSKAAEPMRPPVEQSSPDIKSLSMAAVQNNDRAAQLKALQDAYTRSLQLSPEEEAKQQQLDAVSQRQALLRQSFNEGDSNIRNQAIPMQFVTGQQAALQRQYVNQQEGIAAEALPLKDQLALLQQRRAANQAAAKANLDFNQEQFKAEQDRTKPVEVGNSLIQYDPATGTYKTLYSAPEKAQNPITLGEGQVLIDPTTGKQIAAGNPKSQSENGFTLGEGQMRYDANGNLVASGPAKTAAEKTPSAEMLKLQANVQSGLSAISTLRNAENSLPLGIERVNSPIFNGTYVAARNNLVDIIGRLRSGGAIQADEAKRFESLLPLPTDTDATAKYKLDQMESLLNNTLSTTGQSSAGTDPLQLGFNNAATVQAQNGSTLVSKNPNPTKVITTSSGRYDFSNYATDPNWGNAVKNHLSRMPNFSNPAQITAFIRQQAPSSPLTGEMVIASAQKFGVDPKIILAIAKQEANFATLGRAARTFNPGNVGNVDSGSNINWGSWQAGLDALARNISRRNLS